MTTYEPADVAAAIIAEARGYRIDQAIITVALQKMGVLLVDPASVVTLDPNNDDDVQRLADAIKASPIGAWPSVAEAALRSLLPSPTPPEPNGLGAVVVDADGEWVRISRDSDMHNAWQRVSDDEQLPWGDLRGPDVVSHGVGCTCRGPGCPGGDQ